MSTDRPTDITASLTACNAAHSNALSLVLAFIREARRSVAVGMALEPTEPETIA